jgi:hypothetical protein
MREIHAQLSGKGQTAISLFLNRQGVRPAFQQLGQ